MKMIVCGNCKKKKPHHAKGLCRTCYDERYNKRRQIGRRLAGVMSREKCIAHLHPNWQGGRVVYCCICGAYAGWRIPSQIKRNKTGFRCVKHRYTRKLA